MADTSLGVDYSIRSGPGDDLDGTFEEIYGVQVLLEDAYKTVTTPAGSLEWDVSGTLDVSEDLGDSSDASDRAALKSRCSALLSEDARVEDVTVEVTYDAAQKAETLSITETAVTGQTLTLSVVLGTNQVEVAAS